MLDVELQGRSQRHEENNRGDQGFSTEKEKKEKWRSRPDKRKLHSQSRMTELNPPARSVTPATDFLHPNFRLQGLGPGLPQ